MNKSALHKLLFALLITLTVFVFNLAEALPSWADPGKVDSEKVAAEGPARRDEADKSVKTKLLETGAQLLQDTTPVDQLQMYMDGFHNYKREADLPGEQQQQMRVAHYCQQLNEEFVQCAIYDGNTKAAHLIGIEHIISDKLYHGLPNDQQSYWHSHESEVDTGMLRAPGVPEPAHKALMNKIRTTHGKTWHVWDTHKDALPFGEASLMWSIKPDQFNSQTKSGLQAREQSVKF